MFVPMSIVKRLSQQAQKRVDALRNQLSSADGDRSVDDFEGGADVDNETGVSARGSSCAAYRCRM